MKINIKVSSADAQILDPKIRIRGSNHQAIKSFIFYC